MRHLFAILILCVSLLYAAEIRESTLYLDVNLATAPSLNISGSSFEFVEENQLFKEQWHGKVTIEIVNDTADTQYGIIERIESTDNHPDSDAVLNSQFAWEDGHLVLKHEYWFFLPHSFGDLAQAQAYASSMGYTYNRIQSIPIVNSTLKVKDEAGNTSYFESPLKIYSAENILINGMPYTGEFELCIRKDKLVLNQVLPLEEYLAGVIPNEIGNYSPLEALKAQAVAARSHAVSLLMYNRHTADGYDLCNTTHCQVYKGRYLRNELIEEAVMQTAGEIMMIDGKVADATYHSSCGGKTDSSQAIWKGKPIPHLDGSSCLAEAERYDLTSEKGINAWLKVKPDTRNMSSWERSTLFWTRTISTKQLAQNLNLNKVKYIEILSRGRSGRILKLKVAGDSNLILEGEYNIRKAFGSLPSSMFVFKFNKGKSVYYPGTQIQIEGRGSGHGVGLCQVGTLRKARDGVDYITILKTYYPGIELNSEWMHDEE
jgi:SpoIID/LytB domain protein